MNNFEKEVQEYFQADGWTVLRNGWPDFFCLKIVQQSYGAPEIKLSAVEVKRGADKLSMAQEAMHKALRQAGIPVWVIRPKDLVKKKRSGRIHNSRQVTAFDTYSAKHIANIVDGYELKLKEIILKIEQRLSTLDSFRETVENCGAAFDSPSDAERKHHQTTYDTKGCLNEQQYIGLRVKDAIEKQRGRR